MKTMKKIRNNVLKVMVVGALCSSVVFADGEMGGGGLADTGTDGRGGKTVITRTTEEGEMGGGGLFESMFASIYDCFDRMF